VREASQRRIDGAETIHRELEAFFRRHRAATDEPTEDELERDIKALLRNKRDGKVVIESVKPKLTGGTRKVIDQKFNDSAKFKESDEGSIKE
jgi:pantothenate kinase type III